MTKLQRILCAGVSAVVCAVTPMTVLADAAAGVRTYNETEMVDPALQSVYRVEVAYVVELAQGGKPIVNADGSPHRELIGGGGGSAVLIGTSPGYRYLATNSHVVSSVPATYKGFEVTQVLKRIVKIFKPGVTPSADNAIDVTVVGESPDSKRIDIAFLEAAESTMKGGGEPLKIAIDPPARLQEVYALGYPSVADNRTVSKDATATPGSVSGVSQDVWYNAGGAPFSIIQHSAAISPGNSGGGLVDRCGALIGINTQDAGHGTAVDKEGNLIPVPAVAGVGFATGASELVHLAPPSVHLNTVTGPCKKSGPVPPPPPPPPLPPPVDLKILIFAGVAAVAAAALGGVAYVNMRAKPKPMPTPPEVKGAPAPDPLRLPPVAGARLVLTGKDGNGVSQKLEVNKTMIDRHPDGVILGREPAAGHLRLADDRPKALVSREHARFTLKGEHFQIEDARSSNGTFLNGEKLLPYQARPLRTGDKVRFADLEFIVDIN